MKNRVSGLYVFIAVCYTFSIDHFHTSVGKFYYDHTTAISAEKMILFFFSKKRAPFIKINTAKWSWKISMLYSKITLWFLLLHEMFMA